MIYPSDPDKEVEVVLQADKSAFKAKKVGVPTPINSSTSPTTANGKKNGSRAGSPAAGSVQGQRMRKETDADQIDFNKKILHMSWHPFEDSIAIAATNNVRFQATPTRLSHFFANTSSALCLLRPLNNLNNHL
jgi:serine/threonine-protein phosphatase 2A regulatory subunit B